MESLQSHIKNNTTVEEFRSLTFVEDEVIVPESLSKKVSTLIVSFFVKHNIKKLLPMKPGISKTWTKWKEENFKLIKLT